MAIQMSENFKLLSKEALDGRISYKSLSEMVSMQDSYLYDGCLATIEGDTTKKIYQWWSSNAIDSTLGKWRELEFNGEVPVFTQAEWNALSPEEKLGYAGKQVIISDDIDSEDTSSKGKYIFFGDSYDCSADESWAVNGKWVDKCAELLNITKDEYWDLAVQGTNLASGLWLSFLKNWVENHPDDVKDVKYLVLGGGINDSDSANYPKLSTAMPDFNEYVDSVFPKDTKVYFAYFGWSLDTSPILANRVGGYRCAVQSLYARAAWKRFVYIPGCEAVLHNRNLLYTDGLHPNEEGQRRIAEVVANGLKQGASKVTYGESDAVVNAKSGAVQGRITQYIYGDTNIVNFKDFSIQNCSFTFSDGNWLDIADVKLPYGNRIPKTTHYLLFDIIGTGNIMLNAEFQIVNDTLQMKIFDVKEGNLFNGTAQIIQNFNLSISVNLMSD